MTADNKELIAELRDEAELYKNARTMTLFHEDMSQMRDLMRRAADALEAAERDASRWRFLKDEQTYYYGDGYTEPREAGIHLDWGQGPWIYDGSNGGRGRADSFPGWDSIVDEMMDRAAKELAELDEDAALPAPPKKED